MGCNFVPLEYPGYLTKAEVQTKFDDDVEQSRWESGHSYSGDIGMATGLIFHDDLALFGSAEGALDWLIEHCKKWEEARCVRLIDGTWIIGANCSS